MDENRDTRERILDELAGGSYVLGDPGVFGTLAEGDLRIQRPINRREEPEVMTGIPVIQCDRRQDGTTAGMFAVDGYYVIQKGALPVRQIREYDVKTPEEAHERAMKDGLAQGILVEQYISEPELCILGRKDEKRTISI